MSQSRILLEVGTNELEIVEFYIDEPDGYRGYYGINVSKVIEISRSQPVTAMPQMRHPSVLGAFPFRGGRIVPLIDVSKFLDKGGITSKDPRVIVTEFNKAQMAFLVSGVTRIHRISWKQVEAPSPFLLKMSRGSITAVVRLEGHMLFLLDVEAIVAAMDPTLSVRMDEQRNTPPPTHKYHIIHADDSANIRRLVFDELEKEGRFDISQATDGEEAWKMLQQCKAEAEEKGVPVTDIVRGLSAILKCPIWMVLLCVATSRKIPYLRLSPSRCFLLSFPNLWPGNARVSEQMHSLPSRIYRQSATRCMPSFRHHRQRIRDEETGMGIALYGAIHAHILQKRRRIPVLRVHSRSHGRMSDVILRNVQSGKQSFIIATGLLPAFVCQSQSVRQSCIGQGKGGRSRNSSGHIGHAIVNNALLHKDGIVKRCGTGTLYTATLINGDIHDDGALLHLAATCCG